MEKESRKDVALVLSSGGPRGFAYIGAIESLQAHGFRITSVAGTSMGSLIGGIFAAGKLPEFKEWLYSLDAWKVFSLMDLSIAKNHIVKGERIIDAIREIVPEVRIEDLGVPFCAVAADLYTGEEVVFDRGPLFTAVRASISIPSLFRPVQWGDTVLVDGAVANCLPLDRVRRTENDLLVAFDVNDVNVAGLKRILADEHRAKMADWAFQEDSNLTPLLIRRFAIDLMKDWIFKGYEQFNRDNLQKEKKEYTFDIDGCEVTTSETGYERAKTRVDQFFEKNKWKSITADKFALIFMLMSVCGVLLLGIMAVTAVGAHGFGTGARIALVTGILLVLAGVFLLWRRIVEVLAALQEKKRLALQKLAHSLEELGRWRELFHKEADRISDLERAVSEFGPSAR
jgi:predicted acylesterase/phospholipase RssA